MPVFGDRMMRAILPLEIQEWLNGYAGKSSTTIGKVTSIIQAVYKSACAEGIVSRDPTLGLIKPKPSEPHVKRAFTEEEHERIERTIDAHKHGLFMAVLYHLGLRRGEALGLQWGDFNFTERKVTIERDIDYVNDKAGAVGDLKSKAAYRKIPVPDELLSLLKKSRGLPNRYLFSATGVFPMPYSTFQRMWISLMIDAGFARPVESNGKAKKKDIRRDYETEITPHYFRHDYTTMLYEAGVDPLVAMKILGHKDYATTARIYTHLGDRHIEDASVKIIDIRSKKKVAEKLPATKDD